jgi:hypothetical protein
MGKEKGGDPKKKKKPTVKVPIKKKEWCFKDGRFY